jgi:hypothetical protein
MAVAGEVTQHGQAHPYSWLVTIVSLSGLERVKKQTTEVCENQAPEACSSLSGVSMRQAHASPILAWYYVYMRPRRITQNFLAVLRHFWHSVFMGKICRQLQGYSKFSRYSLRSDIFFQLPYQPGNVQGIQ